MGKTYISSYNELDCLRGIAHKLGGNAASANEIDALRTIVTRLDVVPGNRTVGNMNKVDCLRAIVRHYEAAGPSFDADVTDWADVRVPAAGGTVSAATKDAVNTFVLAAKANGYWTKLNRINLFAGDQLAAALVPLKVGDGGATDTNVNFVAGDYSLATGLTGNGTTKYLNTGLLPSSLVANDTHFAVYNRSSTNAQGGYCGVTQGANFFAMTAPFTDAKIYSAQYNFGAGLLTSAAISTPFGFLVGTRTASNAHVAYRNAVSVANNATSGGSLPTIAAFLFARNLDGTPGSFMSSPLAGYSIGSGLTSGDVTAYNTDMEAFQDALGRGVQ